MSPVASRSVRGGFLLLLCNSDCQGRRAGKEGFDERRQTLACPGAFWSGSGTSLMSSISFCFSRAHTMEGVCVQGEGRRGAVKKTIEKQDHFSRSCFRPQLRPVDQTFCRPTPHRPRGRKSLVSRRWRRGRVRARPERAAARSITFDDGGWLRAPIKFEQRGVTRNFNHRV